jgi:acylphosphatase
MVCKQIIVKGEVQGVYFRASTKEKADEFGVKGEVRNLSDGSVEVIAFGDEAAVGKLVEWCKVGPRLAEVEEVIVNDLPERAFEGFTIVRRRG